MPTRTQANSYLIPTRTLTNSYPIPTRTQANYIELLLLCNVSYEQDTTQYSRSVKACLMFNKSHKSNIQNTNKSKLSQGKCNNIQQQNSEL